MIRDTDFGALLFASDDQSAAGARADELGTAHYNGVAIIDTANQMADMADRARRCTHGRRESVVRWLFCWRGCRVDTSPGNGGPKPCGHRDIYRCRQDRMGIRARHTPLDGTGDVGRRVSGCRPGGLGHSSPPRRTAKRRRLQSARGCHIDRPTICHQRSGRMEGSKSLIEMEEWQNRAAIRGGGDGRRARDWRGTRRVPRCFR